MYTVHTSKRHGFVDVATGDSLTMQRNRIALTRLLTFSSSPKLTSGRIISLGLSQRSPGSMLHHMHKTRLGSQIVTKSELKEDERRSGNGTWIFMHDHMTSWHVSFMPEAPMILLELKLDVRSSACEFLSSTRQHYRSNHKALMKSIWICINLGKLSPARMSICPFPGSTCRTFGPGIKSKIFSCSDARLIWSF